MRTNVSASFQGVAALGEENRRKMGDLRQYKEVLPAPSRTHDHLRDSLVLRDSLLSQLIPRKAALSEPFKSLCVHPALVHTKDGLIIAIESSDKPGSRI